MAIDTEDAAAVDLGHQLVLAHAGLDTLEDAPVHLFDDARSDAHVFDFLRRLDRPLPVDQPGGIAETRLRQVLAQRLVSRRAEVVVVHLHADAQAAPALGQNHLLAQVVHRVALA
ncbi:hypothetical protein D3C78_1208410 [compost metagenome]